MLRNIFYEKYKKTVLRADNRENYFKGSCFLLKIT